MHFTVSLGRGNLLMVFVPSWLLLDALELQVTASRKLVYVFHFLKYYHFVIDRWTEIFMYVCMFVCMNVNCSFYSMTLTC